MNNSRDDLTKEQLRETHQIQHSLIIPVPFCSAALLVVFLTAISPVMAQSAGEIVEEIQITATRRPVELVDVSAALTIVTAEEIISGKLITDSLSAVPGVFLQQTTPGQGAAIVRGLKGSEVLHLVDGMRLNNAIFRNAPTQYMALVAPGTLERIEVVRGASASLYGNDAVGGVVQAISRVPDFDSAGSCREATIAFDTGDLARILRASLESGDEKLAMLASGEYLSTGDRRTGSGDRIGPTGYDSKGARVAVSLTPADDRSWLFDLQYASQPMTPRIDELVPGYGQTDPSSSEFFFAPNERVFGHIRHARDEGLWGADWNFDLGWQRIVDDRISRNYLADIRRYESNSSDLFGLTVNATRDIIGGSWIVGAEYYHDDVRSRRQEENLVSGQINDVTARFPDGSNVDQAAIYGNMLRDVGARHSLSGGVRFSAVSVDLPQSGTIAASNVEQSDISADVGWIVEVANGTQLTANLGYGFRAPNVFDLGTLGERPGNRFNIPSPDLESEHITQFDVGIRHRAESWDLDLVVFALHYTDRIASVLTGVVTLDGRNVTQSRNVASADIRGVEASAHWLISPSVSADVVVNYVRGEQADVDGNKVFADRIPPLNGRMSVRFDWSDDIRIEPYLLFAAKQDRLSPRDIEDVRINPDGTSGWITANVSADWLINEFVAVTVTLENLADHQYRVHGSGLDSVGRSLFLSLRTTW
jgi:hemoglobin/transferrin/lactoferrin receptor protein